MTVRSKWRIAVGVCVLTTGLLMAATGVAVADTDTGSSSSASGNDGSSSSSQQTSSGETRSEGQSGGGDAEDVADDSVGQAGQWRSTDDTDSDSEEESGGGDAEDVADDSVGQPSQRNSTDETDHEEASGGTGAALGVVDPDPVAEVPEEAVSVPDLVAPVPDPVVEVPSAASPVPDPVVEVPSEVPPVPDAVAAALDVVAAALDVEAAPAPDGVAPVSDVSALVPNGLTSVVGLAVPLTQLQSDFYQFLLGVVGIAPASEFSGLLRHMMTAVAGAVVLLMQLPADLYSFLLSLAGSPSVTGGGGAELSPATKAWVVSHWDLVLELAGIPDGLLDLSAVTEVATHVALAESAFIAMKHSRAQSPTSMTSPPEAARPESALSLLEHTAGAFLAPMSLLALAAMALPGIAGLLILCAVGTRFGYRQAMAALALRSTGIARFAHEGPLGVVRSGSLVAVRPRDLRCIREEQQVGPAIKSADLSPPQPKFRPWALAQAG